MRADLDRRVRRLEEQAAPRGYTTLVEYQVRDDHEETDFEQILEELHSKHPHMKDEGVIFIRSFLLDDEEQVPKLLEVRPLDCGDPNED